MPSGHPKVNLSKVTFLVLNWNTEVALLRGLFSGLKTSGIPANEKNPSQTKLKQQQNQNKTKKIPQHKGLGILSGKESAFWSQEIGREEN